MSQQPVHAEFLGQRNGIRFHRIRSDKFKTARTDLFFANPLTAAEAPANAADGRVVGRGWMAQKPPRARERRGEGLYGASYDWRVFKKGDAQIVHLGVAHVADRYASGGEPLFAQSAGLLLDMLRNPVRVDGRFPEDVFAQERENLVDLIRSRVNDKIRYASMRCIEAMCRDDVFAIQAEGGEAEALALTADAAAAAWQRQLRACPGWAYLSGEMPDADVASWMESFDDIGRTGAGPVPQTRCFNDKRQVSHVEEAMDVNQGKLSMGLATGVSPVSADWPAMMVYNGILGGDLHSKLFQNVREKASLAYYASSQLERNKGLMYINSGIEAQNREKAEAIILDQLEDMRRGQITRDEYEATLRSLATAFKAAQDNQFGIVEFYFAQHLLGSEETYASLAEKVSRVTVEDVVRVAQDVRLDTVFFLKPSGTAPVDGQTDEE